MLGELGGLAEVLADEGGVKAAVRGGGEGGAGGEGAGVHGGGLLYAGSGAAGDGGRPPAFGDVGGEGI